ATNQLMTLDELTLLMVQAQRPVELAVELKITPANAGLLEDAVLGWLQRWCWDSTTSTLCPGGTQTQVQVSLMSFSRRAVDRVAETVPAPYVCPLFNSHDGHALQIGNATGASSTPAALLGPSTGWLAHHASVLRRWTDEGRTVRMWTVTTDRQFETAQTLGIQQETVDDPQWALHRVPAPLSVPQLSFSIRSTAGRRAQSRYDHEPHRPAYDDERRRLGPSAIQRLHAASACRLPRSPGARRAYRDGLRSHQPTSGAG